MATWHQQQARQRLYHDTLWTLVDDPPNQGMALTTFPTAAAAMEAMQREKARGNLHVYVLSPASEGAQASR